MLGTPTISHQNRRPTARQHARLQSGTYAPEARQDPVGAGTRHAVHSGHWKHFDLAVPWALPNMNLSCKVD